MDYSLDEPHISSMAPEKMRVRAAQIAPGSATLKAEFEERLNAALLADEALNATPGFSMTLHAQRKSILSREICLALEKRYAELSQWIEIREAGARFLESEYPVATPSVTDATEALPVELEPLTDAPAPDARSREVEKLERDRQQFKITGEVTTRLLCDVHGIERGALGRYLRKQHDLKDAKGARFISTPNPNEFTPDDRTKVDKLLRAGAVTKRRKKPDK